MTQAAIPRSTMTASRACTSGASGVVRTLAIRSSPIRVSTVPMSPAGRWRAPSAEWMRWAVVVLPLVPVMPVISSRRSSVP